MVQRNSQDDKIFYANIVAAIQSEVQAWPNPVRQQALRFLERLKTAPFSPIVALLPHWLSDLAPTPPAVAHQLGVAHLYGWWYYSVQDDLLDEQEDLEALFHGHLALLKMIDCYRNLGLTSHPCWPRFESLAQDSAAAYAIEAQTRFNSLAELTAKHITAWTAAFIIQRTAPFYFNPIAQLELAGFPAQHPRHQAVIFALQQFSLARQLGDDSGDWLADLKQGQLNYVSAGLIAHFWQTHGPNTPLSVEALIGHQIQAESFWDDLTHTADTALETALSRLSEYGPSHLAALLQKQTHLNQDAWTENQSYRQGLRALFGI